MFSSTSLAMASTHFANAADVVTQIVNQRGINQMGIMLHVRDANAFQPGRKILLALEYDELGLKHAVPVAKTARGIRSIALGPAAVAELQLQHRRQAELKVGLGPAWPETGLVFTTSIGRPIQPSPFRTKSWLPVVKAAGLKGLTFHSLRHTHAVLLARAGVQPSIAQGRLGHSKASMTMDVYTHTTAEDQVLGALAVEGLLNTGS